MLRPGDLHLGEGSLWFTVEKISYRGADTLATLVSADGIRWQIPQPWNCPWHPGDQIPGTIHIQDPILFPE